VSSLRSLADWSPEQASLTRRASGIAPGSLAKLLRLFEREPLVERVLLFGSRVRGDYRADSDIDLAVDGPALSATQLRQLQLRVDNLELLYKVDLVHLQGVRDAKFLANIERDGRVLWTPERYRAGVEEVAGTQLKDFQATVLASLAGYLDELDSQHARWDDARQKLQAMEGMEDALNALADYPAKTWEALRKRGDLPTAFAAQPHSSRFDGAGRAIPNVCLKVPTGGGKTLLAAASVGQVFGSWFKRHTGLVLWVVPNDAIYQQTLKTLSDRDHPYRQMLNVAGAGRVKI